MSVPEFTVLYENHVKSVAAGDMKAALADMVQENIPAVFDGVRVPRGRVLEYEIKDIRTEGDLRVGEVVYVTADDGTIGLRSTWELRGDAWKAAALANFAVPGVTGNE
ncbi:hypothetical protein [Williamsia soli]|uniref:hypothetical protein n=1 Tax=Williamsia soli TaxID=364929 RepID=UPI001A9CDC29|nr:hypothetical protein [Williamsia soli]